MTDDNTPRAQPAQAANHQDLDNVVRQIPEMDFAMADFNSIAVSTAPFRDVPSIFVVHLNRPDLSRPDPEWRHLLSFFVTPQAVHGFANLQDLYVLLVRVVLPNAIIKNRAYMLHLYTQYPGIPARNSLRYDGWGDTVKGKENPAHIQLVAPLQTGPRPNLDPMLRSNIPPRPIFRSRPTPDGAQFLHWLCTPPPPLIPGTPVPAQMMHRRSELDDHLCIPEVVLRALPLQDLMRRTIRALNIFWWLSGNNARFESYMLHDWAGVGVEM
jgi:hypothetical protein